MPLVITTCTNRKRQLIPSSLQMSAAPSLPIEGLAGDWARRLAAAQTLFPAREIYCGRSFQEAVRAAQHLDAKLMVVSAGLGLISAEARVPAYACTVLINARDSVAQRVVGRYSATRWWQSLGVESPFAHSLASVTAETGGLIYAALSDLYIEMIAEEAGALPPEVLSRLRLFTRAPVERVASELQRYVMPYDDRLDGPDSSIQGTRGDFASRALRHFAMCIAVDEDDRSVDEHSAAVSQSLSGWRMPERFDRKRLEDAAMLDLIREHWEEERGSTARLLRRFRDDLEVACEQGRFAELARRVRVERA